MTLGREQLDIGVVLDLESVQQTGDRIVLPYGEGVRPPASKILDREPAALEECVSETILAAQARAPH